MMTEPLEEQNQIVGSIPATGELCLPKEGKKHARARGLLVIGLFKLLKALFFLTVGIGALHLVHSDVGDLLLRLTSTFHLDPTGRFVEALQDKVDLISGHKLREVGLYTFLYAGLSLVEGIGLMMEQTWAEYLTLTLTIGALPWDLTELMKHPDAVHSVLVLINLAVLAYLLWFIRWHRQQKRRQVEAG